MTFSPCMIEFKKLNTSVHRVLLFSVTLPKWEPADWTGIQSSMLCAVPFTLCYCLCLLTLLSAHTHCLCRHGQSVVIICYDTGVQIWCVSFLTVDSVAMTLLCGVSSSCSIWFALIWISENYFLFLYCLFVYSTAFLCICFIAFSQLSFLYIRHGYLDRISVIPI